MQNITDKWSLHIPSQNLKLEKMKTLYFKPVMQQQVAC